MIAAIATAGFLVGAGAALIRLLMGPSLADRIAALDVILISLMGAIGVDAASSGRVTNLVVMVVIAVVGFTATVAATRFIEHEEQLP